MTKARFDATKVDVDKDGICVDGRPGGRADRGAAGRGDARRDRPGAERREHRPRDDAGGGRARLHQGQRRTCARASRTSTRSATSIGGLLLAHTAGHEGIVAAHTIAGEKDVPEIDYIQQPRATYCRPEIASVGLTQQQCEERGLPIKVGKVPFQAIAKAIIYGEYEGFAKVIGHAETNDTLGRPHHRPARDRPHRRGVARPRARVDAVGDRRGDPSAPDAVRGRRRGGDGGRRPVDQLLMPGEPSHAHGDGGDDHGDRPGEPPRDRRPSSAADSA